MVWPVPDLVSPKLAYQCQLVEQDICINSDLHAFAPEHEIESSHLGVELVWDELERLL
jgi:hypothetical protein